MQIIHFLILLQVLYAPFVSASWFTSNKISQSEMTSTLSLQVPLKSNCYGMTIYPGIILTFAECIGVDLRFKNTYFDSFSHLAIMKDDTKQHETVHSDKQPHFKVTDKDLLFDQNVTMTDPENGETFQYFWPWMDLQQKEKKLDYVALNGICLGKKGLAVYVMEQPRIALDDTSYQVAAVPVLYAISMGCLDSTQPSTAILPLTQLQRNWIDSVLFSY